MDYPFVPEDVDYFPSDDRLFHAAGIPSLWLGDHDPFYTIHTQADSVETIDFERLTDGVFKMKYLICQLADGKYAGISGILQKHFDRSFCGNAGTGIGYQNSGWIFYPNCACVNVFPGVYYSD